MRTTDRPLPNHPVIIGMILTLIVFIALRFIRDKDEGEWLNAPILILIAGAYAFATYEMLRRTKWAEWSLLGTGLLLSSLGLVIFCVRLFLGEIERAPEGGWMYSAVRALWSIGGPLLYLGFREQRRTHDRERY